VDGDLRIDTHDLAVEEVQKKSPRNSKSVSFRFSLAFQVMILSILST